MKKLIATMAIAGLGAGLAAGAQAQTIGTVGSAQGSSYLINVVETTALTGTPGQTGAYTYTYAFNLASAVAGTNVNSIAFNFPTPGEFDPQSENASGAFGGASLIEPGSGDVFTYTTTSGLTTATPTATIAYTSPLPPQSIVNITPGASGITNGAGKGAPFTGPGMAAVPEASSFALLGLGLLPLGLLARRRMVSNN